MRFSSVIGGRVILLSALALSGCTSAIVLHTDGTSGAGGAGGVEAAGGGGDGSGSSGGGGLGGQGVGGSPPDLCGPFDLSVGLVAHYPFDGDTKDSTGHGHDGVPSGDLPFVEGTHGEAIFFSGIEQRVTVPEDQALDTDSEFSLAAWVNPSAYPTVSGDYPAIIAKWWSYPDGGDYLLNVQIGEEEGLAAFSIADTDPGSPPAGEGIASPGDVKSPLKIPVGVWTQVTATFKLGKLRLFIGGKLAAEEQTRVSHTSLAPYAHDDLVIGNIFTDMFHNYGWQGAIDDVRIYGRALGDDEIACLGAP